MITITVAGLVMIVLAVLLPPLAVFLTLGLSFHFWVNVILTILGYLPGIIHALWVVLR